MTISGLTILRTIMKVFVIASFALLGLIICFALSEIIGLEPDRKPFDQWLDKSIAVAGIIVMSIFGVIFARALSRNGK